jgi:polyketide synthase 13
MTARTSASRTEDEIRDFLIRWIAREIGVPESEIDIGEPFVNFGISSRAAVALSGELEKYVSRELSPSLAWDYPNINVLAAHLAEGAPA